MSHGNHYFLVIMMLNFSLLVKHMTNDSIFLKKLGQNRLRNNNEIFAFANHLFNKDIRLFSSILLAK